MMSLGNRSPRSSLARTRRTTSCCFPRGRKTLKRRTRRCKSWPCYSNSRRSTLADTLRAPTHPEGSTCQHHRGLQSATQSLADSSSRPCTARCTETSSGRPPPTARRCRGPSKRWKSMGPSRHTCRRGTRIALDYSSLPGSRSRSRCTDHRKCCSCAPSKSRKSRQRTCRCSCYS